MRYLLASVPLILLACVVLGCQKPGEPTSVNPVADEEAIREWFASLGSTVENGDLIEWGELFANDIVKLPPDAPVIEGRESVLEWARPFFENYEMDDSFAIEQIEAGGELAVARVTVNWKATPKAGGDVAEDSLKALFVFRRQANGGWKCSHHMWSAANP